MDVIFDRYHWNFANDTWKWVVLDGAGDEAMQ